MAPETLLRSCDARVKVCVAAVGLVVAISARHPVTPLLLAAFAIGSCLASEGLRHLRVLARSLMALAATTVIPIAIMGWFHGLGPATALGARIVGAAAVSFWLLHSTEFVRLQNALAWLRVPRALIELLAYAHRYAAVLRDVLITARDAQALRLGYFGTRRGLHSAGALSGLVFSRAIDQTVSLSDALALRGYGGEWRTATTERLQRGDALVAAVSATVLLLCALCSSWIERSTWGVAW